MNIDDKREYLRCYRIQQARIQRYKEMIEENPEETEHYTQRIRRALEFRNKIEEKIDAVDGGVLSEVLSQKYICGKSMEEIGYCIGYSKRQIERLHLKALDRFCPE